MDGESSHQDYKLTFDSEDSEAKLNLVKDVIAMANAGGGEIIFGRNDTEIFGIETEIAKSLDSAKVADLADRFAKPASLSISHEDLPLENGRVLHTVRVAAAEYPIVMADIGNYSHKSSGKNQHVFQKGDIWTRHSSKTERVTYDDIRGWIEGAKRAEREAMLSRITKVIDIPDGAEIQIVQTSAVPALDTPQRMLEYAAKRRAGKPSYVLPGDDLLELFIHRAELKGTMTEKELSLILASALRRPATLFWWLTLVDDKPDLVLRELDQCLEAADRDKSDAANSVIELAAIYADDQQLDQLKAKLAASRYQHFREAVNTWDGRTAQLAKLRDRILKVKYQKRLQSEMTLSDLETAATAVAILCQGKSASQARQLGDMTRVIWSRVSMHAMGTVV
jgi:hypothetical protein